MAHDFANTKVGDFHFHFIVDQQIRRLKVAVDDFVSMEVAKAVENLTRHVSEFGLRESPVGSE